METESRSFVVECFWPDVSEADLEELDRRVEQAATELAPSRVRYLGSILMREDEVVLCEFDGTAEAVRAVAERAQVPFERVLQTARSPWTSPDSVRAAEAGDRKQLRRQDQLRLVALEHRLDAGLALGHHGEVELTPCVSCSPGSARQLHE